MPPTQTTTELKSRLVAEPVVVRVLEQSLGHPTMVELRLMALDVAEFLSRSKCDRQPLYRLVPTATRWAASPAKPARAVGPVMPGLLRPGQTLEQAVQTDALSLLTNLLDSHPNRDTALREAPSLLRVCTSLVEAGPGSSHAARERYENAFSVLASFIQHPQHGTAMIELLADHACVLVMRDPGPTDSDGLQPGSSQSVYRSLKCLLNIAAPAFKPSRETIDRVLAAGVPARLQQLLSHPLLREEARNVLFNLSATAPEVYLNLPDDEAGPPATGSGPATSDAGGSGASSRAPSSSAGGGSSGGSRGKAAGRSLAAAEAAARKHMAALDVSSPTFNVEDALFAINTCQNLLGAAPDIYGAAMVTVGVPQAMLAACDRIVDAPALQEFKGLSDNAAAMSNVAEICMRFLATAFMDGVLKIVPKDCQDVKNHPLEIELRRCMVPRLRKYLLHPAKVVRGFAAATCMGLGCLSQEMVSQLAASQPTAIQTRLIARLMDPERGLVLRWQGLQDLPPDAIMDVGLPPMSRAAGAGAGGLPGLDWWDELKMCDCCGRHNHFRSELGQEPVKLRRCGGCRERRYCSQECAKAHWKCHKNICKQLQQDPGRQRQAQQAQHAQRQQNDAAATTAAEQQAAAEQQPSQVAAPPADDFAAWTVKQLKAHLAARGVDFSRCIEKGHFDCLDDHLLGLILRHLPARKHGARVALVCTRWRRVYLEEPHIWRSLWLGPGALVSRGASFQQWVAGKLRLLQLVGRHVEQASLDDTWAFMRRRADGAAADGWIDRLVNSVRLPALCQLALYVDQPTMLQPAAVRGELASLRGLTKLTMAAKWLPSSMAAAISRLSALQDLECRARRLPLSLPAAISRLPLTRLSLDCKRPLLPTQPLSGLQQLRSLTLRSLAAGQPLPEPVFLQYPHLTHFRAAGSSFSGFDSSNFTIAGARLERCLLACTRQAGSPGAERLQASITIKALRELRSLPRLLDALLLPGVQLTSMSIENWQADTLPFWPDTVAGCSQLAALEDLKLTDSSFDSDADEAVGTILEQAPCLRRLWLWTGGEAKRAACLAMLPPGVTALNLGYSSVPSISADRLCGLLSLEVVRLNHWFEVAAWPPCLSGATGLTRLKLSYLALRRPEAESVVQHMPQLQQLAVMRLSAEVLGLLQQGMPSLDISGTQSIRNFLRARPLAPSLAELAGRTTVHHAAAGSPKLLPQSCILNYLNS
ncbi:MYND finger domain-containing isoform B [Chlorella sorokiniana]|uniref:MYND finger domain-containing isoform B n=1 Tax=Chlorella sorokiniana TaxID=3076 RepID=A0A2P6TYZ3_CHLSO|nr:MYND finger domain-containing isoform B [Chlorella sorokiniana]|eukprot:PRW59286.1 MYND finger domain-containing isoform B [Chlorella sorokiniana]